MLTAQLWHALKSAHEGKSTEGPASGGFGKVDRRLTPTNSIFPCMIGDGAFGAFSISLGDSALKLRSLKQLGSIRTSPACLPPCPKTSTMKGGSISRFLNPSVREPHDQAPIV
jgi:hypothetical protein